MGRIKIILILTYTYTYIHACMHACIHTYIHTYMHACMHACIHTYIHTYIHTDISPTESWDNTGFFHSQTIGQPIFGCLIDGNFSVVLHTYTTGMLGIACNVLILNKN